MAKYLHSQSVKNLFLNIVKVALPQNLFSRVHTNEDSLNLSLYRPILTGRVYLVARERLIRLSRLYI